MRKLREQMGKDVDIFRLLERKAARTKSQEPHVIDKEPLESSSKQSVSLSAEKFLRSKSSSGDTENSSDWYSDGSTDQDVSHILHHSIASEDDFLIDVKRRNPARPNAVQGKG